jgi:hypothetical protein
MTEFWNPAGFPRAGDGARRNGHRKSAFRQADIVRICAITTVTGNIEVIETGGNRSLFLPTAGGAAAA